MERLFKCYRLPMLTTLCGSLLLLGCTKAEYDFDKVDYTLGFGGETVTLPGNNSTKEIMLDDLLDISTSDLITTEANGDYKLFKEPDDAVEPVEINVSPIIIDANKSQGLSFDINLPAFPTEILGQEVDLPYTSPTPGQSPIDILEETGNVSLLEYEFDADDAIKSLEYVEVGENGQGVDLVLNLQFPTEVKKFERLKINLPNMLEMECPSMADKFNKQSNVLTLTNYTVNGSMSLVFKVSRINVKTIDENNFVKLDNGMLKLKAYVDIAVKPSRIIVPNTDKLTVYGEANFNTITITEARGVFDPEIDLDDVGTVNINSLPDFLTDEEVVADIDNPQIWLTLSSTMPLGGTINAQLTSDTHPTPIVLNPISVAASTDGINPALTRIVICRQAPTGLTGYTPMIVPNLSELIEKLKEPMKINFTVTSAKASQETANFKLGLNYTLTPKYRFECPLAFGDKAIIVYSETQTNWNKDIYKLQLAKDAYVQVTGTAINKIPADLTLEVTPLDKNGQKLNANDLKIDLIKKDIAGAKDAPTESSIEVKISGDISRLDGVTMKLKAKSNEQLRGVTLNKTSQTLKLKDLTVKVVGKVIYDAN